VTRHALILANGEPPTEKLLRALCSAVQLVVCADGGANAAWARGLRPDAIVGDLDSIRPETLAAFRGVPVHEDHDEFRTDLEKAVRWTLGCGCEEITIVGALGRRVDHTVANLGMLPRFHAAARIRIVDEIGELTYVDREVHFEAPLGTLVSLVPLNRCEGIVTEGLRYALAGEDLELGLRDGTSNVVVASPVTIRVARGHLLLYRVRSGDAVAGGTMA
jgi:thiamine pyrophosphokinase